MHLLLWPIAVCLVRDKTIPFFVLHEALRGNFVELPGLSHVVTFYVLCMGVVLHDGAVPVAILALLLQRFKVAQFIWIVDRIRDSVIEIRVPPLVARRDRVLSPQTHFDLPSIVAMFCLLFVLRIVELLYDRVKAVRRHVLM